MKTKSTKRPKLIIGARDKIDLPEFNLLDLPCKVDTGAATSAIHCYKVQLREINGKEVISFRLLDPAHEAYNGKEFRTHNFKEKKITSSSGHSEYRYVIKSRIVLFGKEIETEFTLADRIRMRYPVLLGRKLLRRRFIVDVTQKDLSYQQKLNIHD
jgi:hypothetical protein